MRMREVSSSITVIKGEGVTRTLLSLQFVHRGSKACGEYGCFVSGERTLKEIENIMGSHGISPEELEDFPSIVMVDGGTLKKKSLRADERSCGSSMLLGLLRMIHEDIKFTRLSIDCFNVLYENNKREIDNFFDFARTHKIEVLLTINSNFENHELLEKCDNFIVVKKAIVPTSIYMTL